MPEFKARVQAFIASLMLLASKKRMKALKEGIQDFPPDERNIVLTLVTAAVNITEENMKTWEKITMIASGGFFFIFLLIIALAVPKPSDFQIFVFRVVLSSAAAAFGTTIPGMLSVDLKWVKAGSALALFVLVYLVNPPALVTGH